MERVKFFRDYGRYVLDVKNLLRKHLRDFEVYVFGSVVRGDFSPGLSDVDVAIVSDEFENREKRLEVYDVLFERYFDTPLEFHLLTRRRWELYMRFIGEDFVKI